MTVERGFPRFEPYGPPKAPATIATACRDIDGNAAELDAIRRDNTRLRREAANHHASAESERAESARLRRENQALATQLEEARWNA